MPKGRSGGSSWAQISWANGHRVRNRHPDGGLIAEGSSPRMWPTGLARARATSGFGNGVDQRPRIGVDGLVVHVAGPGPISTSLPRYMTPDGVGHVLDHRQVVRDHDVGELVPALQLLQEIQDLGLDRHVQGRHRLVGHDQPGLERQRPGQPDALALAAGEFVRVELGRLGAQPDLAQQRTSTCSTRSAAVPMPWTTSGSRRIVPTRMRGSSDA